MSSAVLRLDNVLIRAGQQSILEVPCFAVGAGETVALVGPNGAGKSTLLHVAALLRRAEAGTVTVLGHVATPRNAAALRRALSVVFQEPLLFDTRVLANAAAGVRFQGRPRVEAERCAGVWLERFGVAHLAARRARDLSGGEATRVALARAFATDPAILLLDEPFSALDAPTRASLLPVLRERLHETGAAAVFVTHDLDEAFAYGDRAAVMDAGRIVASGSPPAMIARPPSRRAAELLGIETILAAQLVHVDGTCALVALGSDGPVARVLADSARLWRAGQAAIFTLPAGVTHAFNQDEVAPHGWNLLSGVVAAVMPLSSGTRLLVQTPAPIVARAASDAASRRWAAGDRVIVAFAPEAPHLIPYP